MNWCELFDLADFLKQPVNRCTIDLHNPAASKKKKKRAMERIEKEGNTRQLRWFSRGNCMRDDGFGWRVFVGLLCEECKLS